MSGGNLELKNPVLRWVDTRLPIFSYVHEHLVVYPAPKNLNWWWSFGSLAGIALMIMMLTGIILAMHYTPHVDYAFQSVEHIMRDVNYGWLLRYIHANAGSLFFLVVYVHIFRGLYYGSYQAPRELLWIIGLFVFVLMMATGFLGYVLPWGQMSFWAVTVITNLFSAVPVVGEQIVNWLWGGFSVGNPTLNRFYSLHYLLPFVIVAMVFIHLWALHTTKSSNPLGIEVKDEKQDTIPFHPYYTMKDMVGLAVFLIVLFLLVFFSPNSLGHPDNYIPANPMVTPTHIVPEWYYLPFYAILKAVPDKLGGVIAMVASIGVLFLVPWLDRSKVRSCRFRPRYKQFFWILVADCLILGVVGANPPEGMYLIVGRLATVYYFLHFLFFLPLVSIFEKPLPLPASISEPVLKEGQ